MLSMPPLLGLNFLNHESIQSYFITKNSIILNRKIYNIFFKNKINFEGPSFFCNLIYNEDKNVGCRQGQDIIVSKIQEAKQNLNVQINENSNSEQAEKIADLLLEFKDVFGVDSNDKLGSFPLEIPILTEGKPIHIKQHPIIAPISK